MHHTAVSSRARILVEDRASTYPPVALAGRTAAAAGLRRVAGYAAWQAAKGACRGGARREGDGEHDEQLPTPVVLSVRTED